MTENRECRTTYLFLRERPECVKLLGHDGPHFAYVGRDDQPLHWTDDENQTATRTPQADKEGK